MTAAPDTLYGKPLDDKIKKHWMLEPIEGNRKKAAETLLTNLNVFTEKFKKSTNRAAIECLPARHCLHRARSPQTLARNSEAKISNYSMCPEMYSIGDTL